jgi:hypothetical protein
MSETDDALGVLWGVKAIAAYIGRTERQTRHLISTKKIPAEKFGANLIATKSRLRAVLSGAGR